MDILTHLFLYEFQLLCFQQFFRDTLRVRLCTQAEIPQFFAKLGGVLIKKSGERDLQSFDVGLNVKSVTLTRWGNLGVLNAYESRTLEQVKAQFDHNVIFRTKNVRYLACNPPRVKT